MDFSMFDLIVGSIILLLGLKGILNGFFKELFGLLGIVGGIFIGSRLATDVGTFLSDAIFKFDSPAAINFTGFLTTLAVFWGIMIALGITFKKFSKISGLGIIDRIFGFIFGSGKFFFIASVIIYSVYNFKSVRDNFDMSGSIMFPILVETGSVIMHIDGGQMAEDINSGIDAAVAKTQDTLNDKVNIEISDMAEKEKNKIKDAVNQKLKENNISLGDS